MLQRSVKETETRAFRRHAFHAHYKNVRINFIALKGHRVIQRVKLRLLSKYSPGYNHSSFSYVLQDSNYVFAILQK